MVIRGLGVLGFVVDVGLVCLVLVFWLVGGVEVDMGLVKFSYLVNMFVKYCFRYFVIGIVRGFVRFFI